MSFSGWLKETSMNQFRSFALTILFCLTVTVLTAISCIMLLDDSSAAAALNKDPAIRAAAQTTETSHHSYGMQVITAVLSLMGVAIGVNAAAVFGDRSTAKEYLEAKERGKVSGVAAAAVAAQVVQDAQNGIVTKDHAAVAKRASQAMSAIQSSEPDMHNDDESGS